MKNLITLIWNILADIGKYRAEQAIKHRWYY